MAQGFSSSVASPGTPQRLTAGATPALPTISGVLACTLTPYGDHIVVQNSPSSAGNLYVGAPTLSVSGKTGWYAILAPGAAYTTSVADNGSDLGLIYVDSDGAASYGVSYE